MISPGLVYAFEAQAEVGPALELGEIGGGRRRIIPILGGQVSGPRLSGRILRGGADWQTLHPGGRAEILARYWIEAADGAVIGITNAGVRHAAQPVVDRMLAGEPVGPEEYYFRTTPVFEVAAGPHAWLLHHVFVCAGQRWPDRVVIRFFAVS